jgi:hypothetical protein
MYEKYSDGKWEKRDSHVQGLIEESKKEEKTTCHVVTSSFKIVTTKMGANHVPQPRKRFEKRLDTPT